MYILPADKDKYYNKPKPLDSSNDLPGKSLILKHSADPGDLLIWTRGIPLGIKFRFKPYRMP